MHCFVRLPTWCGALALLTAPACGDDLPTNLESLDAADSTTGTDTLPTDEGGPPPTQATTGPGPQTTSSSSSSDGSEPLEVEVVAYTYPNQPMVVDLAFSAPDLEISASHTSDPGVRTGSIEGAEGETWIRARGLAPGTEHTFDWQAGETDGRTDLGQITFTTEEPLPGFIPSFTIEGTGDGFGGYVLFDLLELTPEAPASIFMIDNMGVARWHLGRTDGIVGPTSVFAGAKLREDGSLLYIRDYTLYVVDEMGVELLSLSSTELGVPGLHHDVVELDNGNFLALSYTFRDIDYPDIGLTYVAGDLVVEIDPEGGVVWEWDAFDHLDPMRRRDGFEAFIFDVETMQNAQDWTHGNGFVYDPYTNSILFSARHQDWLINIDAATGDVLWRFGEEGDFGLAAGTWQYHQHSPEWQEDDTLLLYDNGLANPNLDDELETSRAVRYAIDFGSMMVTQVWEDEAEDFLVPIAGDADRLPNGNILVTDSSIDLAIGMIHARVREIDEDSSATPQWSFTTEIGTFIYRCTPWLRLPGELIETPP